MNAKVSVLSVALFGLVAAPAIAQGPPIHTDTPIALGLEGRGVRTFARVIRLSSDRLDQRITTTLLPVVIPYNITTKGVAGIIIPTVFKEVQKGGMRVSSSGLGDISLFAKYVVLQIDRPGETFRLAPKAVLKFPTGDEKGTPPLGNGSADVSFGVVAAWLRGRFGVYTEDLYRVNGEANGRALGNGLAYNLALGYRLLPIVYETYPAQQVNAYLELNGSWTQKDKLKGRNLSDSGGHVLSLSPGIQYIPLSRLLVEASLQVPLVKDLNGTQLEPDWTVNAGIRILLF